MSDIITKSHKIQNVQTTKNKSEHFKTMHLIEIPGGQVAFEFHHFKFELFKKEQPEKNNFTKAM